VTQPRLAYKRSGREYRWPARPPHELMVPSTTTIIGGGVPKDALKFWAAKSVAQWAYDHRDEWDKLPREAAVDLLKREPLRFTESKAELGDIVHAAIEAFLGRGGEPTGLDERAMGYFKGALAFLTDQVEDILLVERTVFSRTHGYAGTLDLVYTARQLPGPVVGDWKTSKAVYDETSLQLAASAFADFVAGEDGVTEEPMPAGIEYGTTIRLTPTGLYEAVPFVLTDELFAIFLAAKTVADRESTFRTAREWPLTAKEAA
jgi:hypothetical protein